MTETAQTPAEPEAPIRLSPSLDVDALRSVFQRTRRLHIPDILSPESAERVTRALETHPSWSLSVRAAETFEMPLQTLDAEERARLDAVTGDPAATHIQYKFDTWRVSVFVDAGHRTGGAVEALYDFLNGEEFLGFMRAVTGDGACAFSDAQATRYRRGHFLTTHNDASEGKNRLYAYVLNFTRTWRPDWGGQLQFVAADGHVDEAYMPAFNALNIFAVPREHAVSCVAPFAGADRLSVTGWVRGGPPPRRGGAPQR